MRTGNNNTILFDDTGKLIGISFGSDFTAEHEWGIRGINQAFGIEPKEKDFGLCRRTINKRPTLLTWYEGQHDLFGGKRRKKVKFAGFVLPREANYLNEETSRRYWYDEQTLWTGWDEKTFAALSIDEKEVAILKKIYVAFETKDIAIWLGGGGIFQNAGLAIGIASRLSEDVRKQWFDVDKDYYDTRQLMKKSGIEKRLEKAGKRYYSLLPKKRDDNGQLEIWLNPSEQQSNNSGWYSVQDLDDWIDGKGKIPKVKS